ncbi:MAG: hypothetical protein ACRDY7_17470 [Acidimicrobiia bacterium]
MALLKTVGTLAFRRGTRFNSRGLLVLGVGLRLVAWARDRSQRPPPLIHREVLAPSDTIRIRLIDPKKGRS